MLADDDDYYALATPQPSKNPPTFAALLDPDADHAQMHGMGIVIEELLSAEKREMYEMLRGLLGWPSDGGESWTRERVAKQNAGTRALVEG